MPAEDIPIHKNVLISWQETYPNMKLRIYSANMAKYNKSIRLIITAHEKKKEKEKFTSCMQIGAANLSTMNQKLKLQARPAKT